MIKFKSLLSISTGALALLILGGCLAGEDDAGGNSNISASTTIEVLDINPPTGSEPGVITTRYVDSYCDDGDLVRDTVEEESNYLVSGGHLYLWTEGDCLMTKFSGSSSTIVGTWTGTSVWATDSVPAAHRPSVCNEDEDYEEGEDFYEDFSVQYKISETEIKGKMTGKLCFAKTFASFYQDDEEAGFQVTSESCSEVKVKNTTTNKTATITSSYNNDSAIVKFSYDGEVCTGAIYLGLTGNVQSCSDDDDDESLEDYFTCVVESGFYGEVPLEKRQSLEKGMLKSLKPDLSGPF